MRTILACTVDGLALLMLLFLAGGGQGCSTSDNPLASYGAAGRSMAAIVVEDSTITPRVTWLGGYATVFGVNRGNRAILDTSLVWLVNQAGNSLRYPIRFGTIPSGARDITASFGGTPASSLTEDLVYTFWILRDDAWSQISEHPGLPVVFDSAATSAVEIRNDTVFVSAAGGCTLTKTLDLYINVKEVKPFGRLARINVVQSSSSNRPTVTFTITQTGVTDSLVAAIGVTAGLQYDINNIRWEMISADSAKVPPVFYKNNVIRSPIVMGDTRDGTATFTAYPENGLARGNTYYIWIASKDWDGTTRLRSTPNYAFATFMVW